VPAEAHPIEPDLGVHVDAVEEDPDLLPAPLLGYAQVQPVPAHPAHGVADGAAAHAVGDEGAVAVRISGVFGLGKVFDAPVMGYAHLAP